jgi:choline dehydrogenase-like flavoprotein
MLCAGFMRTATDEKKLVRLFRMLLEWADRFQAATGLKLQQQPGGGNAIEVTHQSSDDEVLKAARGVLSTHWHVSQSCRMGPASDAQAVVDPRFRAYGLEGLRIVDASSQPVLTNGHPMAVLVMMAERAVDFMLEDEARTRL